MTRAYLSTEWSSSVWTGTVRVRTVPLDLACVSTADRTHTSWAVLCCPVGLFHPLKPVKIHAHFVKFSSFCGSRRELKLLASLKTS